MPNFTLSLYPEKTDSITPEKINSHKISKQINHLILLVLLSVWMCPGIGFAQEAGYTYSCSNCTASDIKVTNVTLAGYNPNTCPPFGSAVFSGAKQIKVEFEVTAAERYGLLFLANLYINNSFVNIISQCFPVTYTQGYNFVLVDLPADVNFNVGDKIELKNVFTAWDNNKNANPPGNYVVCGAYVNGVLDCKAVAGNSATPKCKYYPEAINVKAPAKPQISIDSTRSKLFLTCNGDVNGTIFTTVDPVLQQAAPYTFSWNQTGTGQLIGETKDSIKNRAAGIYTVIVKADVCSDTAVVEIRQPSKITATLDSLNLSCNGDSTGKAWVQTVSGGTPATVGAPYTYTWTKLGSLTPLTNISLTGDSAYGLKAGTYIVTIKDSNNCAIEKTVTITQPTQITISITKTNYCSDPAKGSASAAVTGGTQKSGVNYIYSWTKSGTGYTATTASITGIDEGKYYLTVTDSLGCTRNDSVSIYKAAAFLSVSKKDSLNVKCYGDSTGWAKITISGGQKFGNNKYNYSWNTYKPGNTTDSVYRLTAGKYKVTITDSFACSITDSFQIKQPDAPLSLTMKVKDSVKCFGGSTGKAYVTAIGGTPKVLSTPAKYTYAWKDSAGNSVGTNSDTLKNVTAGKYKVTVTDSLGCTKTDSVVIWQPTKLTATKSQTNVSCFGFNNGIAVIKVSGGVTPYSYSWNSTPSQTKDTAKNLAPGKYKVTVTDANGCTLMDSVTITQPAAALSATKSKVDVKCFGAATGKAIVKITGGTAPYTYSWNSSPVQTKDTAVSLIAGTYICTTTDVNGCTRKDTLVVTQPAAALSSVRSKVDVKCFGATTGNAIVKISGGTAPYTYSWNTTPVQTKDTAVNLAAGIYIATVTDANSCTLKDTVTITQPASALTATKAKEDLKCDGNAIGKAIVKVSGGTAPYTYSWNTNPVQTTDTAKGLGAGTYICTTTDASGCTRKDTVTIISASTMVSARSKEDVKCNGAATGKAIVKITGGTAPYAYSWNTTPVQTTDTAKGLAAGIYIVTITDSGQCAIKDTVTITEPAKLASVKSKVDVGCFGNTDGKAIVKVSGGTTPYTYSWNTTPVQTSDTAKNLAPGTYIVTITDANSCSRNDTVVVNQPSAALSSVRGKEDVKCFGTATGKAFVKINGGTTPYTYSWNTTPVQTTDTAKGLAVGTYIVTITDAAQCIFKDTVTLTQPASALSTTVTKEDVKCDGSGTGWAVVKASGGVAPYTYSWNSTPIQTTDTAKNLAPGNYIVTTTDANGCSKKDTVTILQNSTISTTKWKEEVKCFGGATGKASVKVSGGTSPYTYSWNTTPVQTKDTATGLTAGAYTVLITDAKQCTRLDTITITQPAALATVKSTVSVKCYGESNGKAIVKVSGGTSPYTYAWNTTPVQTKDTATGLAAGTYVVTITDANSCTRKDTLVVAQPNALSSTKWKKDVSCNGGADGKAAAIVSGGTAPFTYSWNTTPIQTKDTAKGLSPGTYVVTITDANACSRKDTFTITQPASKLASQKSKEEVKCYGAATGKASVTISGGTSPYTYSWNTSPVQTKDTATGLTAGTYIVTATDAGGCVIKDTVTINQPATAVTATALPDSASICKGDSTVIRVHASGGTPPYSYKLNSGSYVKGVDTFKVYGPGTYTITVKDSLDCTKTLTVTVNDKGCDIYCTYTQGYFGTDNNGQASYNNGSGCKKTVTRTTINASLTSWLGNGGLKVGNINVSGLADPVQAILDYLPGGGPSVQYTGTTLGSSTPKNTLLSQTLTLGLNIGLNKTLGSYRIANGAIITQHNDGDCGSGSPISGSCKSYPVNASFNGKTVLELFNAASTALASGSAEDRSAYANVTATINEAFDRCAKAVNACPSSETSGTFNLANGDYDQPSAKLAVKTYPNPFTDQVYFQFVSPVAGDAVFEIFDFTGRKIKEIKRSNIQANQDVLIRYMIPKVHHREILYRVRVNEYQAFGLLLAPSN